MPLSSLGASQNTTIKEAKVQGTSWVELLIFFELVGGSFQTAGVFNAPKSLKSELLLFEKMTRLVADTCLGPGDRNFLRPSKIQVNRLKLTCFSNFVSCINAQIFIPEALRPRMLQCLVSLRIALPPAKCLALQRGQLLFQPTKLKGGRPPQWRRYIHMDNQLCECLHLCQNTEEDIETERAKHRRPVHIRKFESSALREDGVPSNVIEKMRGPKDTV